MDKVDKDQDPVVEVQDPLENVQNPVLRVQSLLDILTKPLYEDDPFSREGRRTNIFWSDGDPRGLSFRAFVNRMMTFQVQHWGANPNAALYLAKYGFVNLSESKVKCCTCSIEVDMDIFCGKLDLLRNIAVKSHKPSCWWLYLSAPSEYFKIPRNPQKLAKDFLTAVQDLMTFRDDLPLISEHVVPGQFIKMVMEALDIVDESQMLLSSIYIGLCGWVKASDLSFQCNFCQRVCGLWNFINIHDSLHGSSPSVKTGGRVVSMLYNQIRGLANSDEDGDKSVLANNSLYQSGDSDISKENETANQDESKVDEMSVCHSDNDSYEDNFEHITVLSPTPRSFFCAKTRKRNAIKILCRKMRRLQGKSQEILNSSDTDYNIVQDSDCDVEYSGESKRMWCRDSNSKSIMQGEFRNGSNNKEIVSYERSVNVDGNSEIQQNGYSDEHFREDCVAKTNYEGIECVSDPKSTVFTHKQSLDKQSVVFSKNSNPCDTLVYNENETAKMSNLQSKTSPKPLELPCDRNSKDCDSSTQINSCQTDGIHTVNSENNVLGQDSKKTEDNHTGILKPEQNGKSNEHAEETGKENITKTGSLCDGSTPQAPAKSLVNDVSDKMKKVDASERNNGVDNRYEVLQSSESNKYSHEIDEKNDNESGNNYGEFNNDDNQLTPVICSVVGNAVMDSTDDYQECGSSPTKENDYCEGPIIVSSKSISEVDMSVTPKIVSDNKELVCAGKSGEPGNVNENEMDTSDVSAPKLNEESEDPCHAQSPPSSPSVEILMNVKENENEESSSNKRKRDEECQTPEHIENTKKIKEASCEPIKCYFHPVLDHRYWCIWKVKTSDFTGVSEGTKAGWQYAFDVIQEGLERLNADKNVSYSEVQLKTIDCINTICSMGRPG